MRMKKTINSTIVQTIISLLNGFNNPNNNLADISCLKYLLGQAIRAYEIPDANIHVSVEASKTWNLLTTCNIRNFGYREMFKCDRLLKASNFTLYKGSSGTGSPELIKPNDPVCFNDMFHLDHIVPVAVIIEELQKLSCITAPAVTSILEKMHLCYLLKEEDRRIGRTKGRTIDYLNTIKNVYNTKGIFI